LRIRRRLTKKIKEERKQGERKHGEKCERCRQAVG